MHGWGRTSPCTFTCTNVQLQTSACNSFNFFFLLNCCALTYGQKGGCKGELRLCSWLRLFSRVCVSESQFTCVCVFVWLCVCPNPSFVCVICIYVCVRACMRRWVCMWSVFDIFIYYFYMRFCVSLLFWCVCLFAFKLSWMKSSACVFQNLRGCVWVCVCV
jgi:hypothetical protein